MSIALLAGIALQTLALGDSARAEATPPADSARARRQARGAQRSFELRRVSLLPYRLEGANACEVRIGRMCYSWGGRNDHRPRPEPPSIGDARAELLAELRDAARLVPGDEWVAGQLVHYLIEADSAGEAERFARESCAASAWWCQALTGWAAHEGERFAEAETAFERALESMDMAERCEWENIEWLLESPVSSRYRRLNCEQRRVELSRLMWLARPLFSSPGNDLLTEHYSRHALERVLRSSRNPYGINWGDDLRELVVRYGWAYAWSRRPQASAYSARDIVSGTERGLALQFFPDVATLGQPSLMSDASWNLEARQAPARYAPRWADGISSPPHQLARFRRGDSVIVVAAYDVTADSAFGDSARATLALVPSRPGEYAALTRGSGRSARVVAHAPRAGAELASLEVLDRSRKAAARTRSALADDRESPSLSDVLLFNPDDAPEGVDSLADAVKASLTSPSARTGTQVGVFWELYSLSPTDSIGEVSLTLSRERGGTLRRLAESLRILERPLPVSLEWQDRTRQGARVTGRSVVVDLAGVPEGRYVLELEVRSGGRELRALRAITISP